MIKLDNDSVTSFLLEGKIIEVGDKKLCFNRTKKEDQIRLGLRAPSNNIFENLIPSDPFLISLFFFRMSHKYAYDITNLVRISIPLITDISDDFVDNILTTQTKSIEDLNEKAEKITDQAMESGKKRGEEELAKVILDAKQKSQWEAAQIITEAKRKAEQVVSEAENKAKMESDRVIAQVMQKAQQIIDEAEERANRTFNTMESQDKKKAR